MNFSRKNLATFRSAVQLAAGHDEKMSGTAKNININEIALTAVGAKLFPALWPAVRYDEHVNNQLKRKLHAAHLFNTYRNQNILNQAEKITITLNEAGLMPVALKGVAHLITNLWGNLGSRPLGDIDLLLPEDKIFVATYQLNEKFAVETMENVPIRELRERSQHLAPFMAPSWHVQTELHTRILPVYYSHLLTASEVIDSSTPHRLGKATILIPSPTHRTLHAILHWLLCDGNYFSAGLSGRDLVDLLRLKRVYKDRIDWLWIDQRLSDHGWPAIPEIVNFVSGSIIGHQKIFLQLRRRNGLSLLRWRLTLIMPILSRLGIFYIKLYEYFRLIKYSQNSRLYVFSRVSDPINILKTVKKILLKK